MTSHRKTNGWNLDQGLAAQYAAQAGLDPDLAAGAGEKAWNVLRSLRATLDETNSHRRGKRSTKTRRLLAKADLGRHPDLKKAIQVRLFEVEKQSEPSINPETGLQEFFGPPLPTRKPSDTQTFYWRDKWAKYKPDIEFAEAVKGSFESDLSDSYDAHSRRNAQMNAFVDKWLPSNPRLDEIPDGQAQQSDFLRLQGISPKSASLAPIIDSSTTAGLVRRKGRNGEIDVPSVPAFDAINSPGVSHFHFYNPADQSLRLRVPEVFDDDPLHGVYKLMNETQIKSRMNLPSDSGHDEARKRAANVIYNRIPFNKVYP